MKQWFLALLFVGLAGKAALATPAVCLLDGRYCWTDNCQTMTASAQLTIHFLPAMLRDCRVSEGKLVCKEVQLSMSQTSTGYAAVGSDGDNAIFIVLNKQDGNVVLTTVTLTASETQRELRKRELRNVVIEVGGCALPIE